MVLNFLLAWGFGWGVIALLWWLSMPARWFLMTAVSGVALLSCLSIGGASYGMCCNRMRTAGSRAKLGIWYGVRALSAFLLLAFGIIFYSYQKTEGSIQHIAKLSLIGEEIVERPEGWLPHDIARKDFRAEWCARESPTDCSNLGDREGDFQSEWQTRRDIALSDMRRPDWHKPRRPKPDFRNASLFRTFLSGADLSDALLTAQPTDITLLEDTNLRAAANDGGARRFVDLTDIEFNAQTDFRNAFLDGSVAYADAFARQMGASQARPCQWWPTPITEDAEFFGRWRGWLEHPSNPNEFLFWSFPAPDPRQDVTPIPPARGL